MAIPAIFHGEPSRPRSLRERACFETVFRKEILSSELLWREILEFYLKNHKTLGHPLGILGAL